MPACPRVRMDLSQTEIENGVGSFANLGEITCLFVSGNIISLIDRSD